MTSVPLTPSPPLLRTTGPVTAEDKQAAKLPVRIGQYFIGTKYTYLNPINELKK